MLAELTADIIRWFNRYSQQFKLNIQADCHMAGCVELDVSIVTVF